MKRGPDPLDPESIQSLLRAAIASVGENPDRPGLAKTPERVIESFRNFTAGYGMTPADVVNGALFEERCDDMVMIRGIDLYSLCEHHLLPFYGRCHVAYIPKGKLIGLSKVPRIVEVFSKRLQVQERLTNQIADALMEVLRPRGVAVVIDAFHLCMAMRGVEKQNAHTRTSALLGCFRRQATTRAEFFSLLRKE